MLTENAIMQITLPVISIGWNNPDLDLCLPLLFGHHPLTLPQCPQHFLQLFPECSQCPLLQAKVKKRKSNSVLLNSSMNADIQTSDICIYYKTLKLVSPCMFGADISWCITDMFLANVAKAPCRLSPIVL